MPLTMFLYLFTFLDKYVLKPAYNLIARMSTKDVNQVDNAKGTPNGSQKDFYITESLYYAGFVTLEQQPF